MELHRPRASRVSAAQPLSKIYHLSLRLSNEFLVVLIVYAFLSVVILLEKYLFLDGYEDVIINAAEKYEPSVVVRYVIVLATAFNKFYHDCAVLQAEDKEKMARLLLTDLVQKILGETCGLLGMECPEEM